MISDSDKVRENRLRRQARRHGLQLIKSRRRDPSAIDFGGYMLVEPCRNFVIFGSDVFPFSASLDDIDDFLNSPD